MSIEPVNIPLRHELLLRKLIDAKNKYLKNEKINLVDIGASNGAFLELLSKKMKDINHIDAVEIDQTFKKRIENFGHFYNQDLQTGIGNIPKGKYQIATLWEFIEHIEDSYSFFRNLKEILADNALVALSTPNLISLSRLVKGKHWIGVRDTSHKILYDKLSLQMILEHCGYEILTVRKYYFPNRFKAKMDWLNNLLSKFPGGGMLFILARKLNLRDNII